ncbi:hypothetical protein Forpe1208_v016170 [Fusarium oxysporum f. sp. rapae]|uniref:Uncharacterized protein n=1 Tax=Fusarium oxysporum f. sp. rapae TaxID=485398 RepID=A0A8J5TMV8_FUSOX|nr:hypothetical protein Forpe1208_v016170 [Fusarium oxysporum f. sp. rapae]
MEDPTDGQDPFAPPRTNLPTAPLITHTECNKSGDDVLVTYLDNGRDPDIAREAARESLPFDEDSPDEVPRRGRTTNGNLMRGPLLQRLAADALQAVSIATASPSLAPSVPEMIPDKSTATRHCSIHDEPPIDIPFAPRVIPPRRVPLPDRPQRRLRHGVRALAGESKDTLPSQSLPSLRSTFGELGDLHPERPSEQDLGRVSPGPFSTFPTSPAASLGYSFNLNTNPPSSPPDGYRALSPHSASTPATSASINSTSITDRMSSDGIRHPQPVSDMSVIITQTKTSTTRNSEMYSLRGQMD